MTSIPSSSPESLNPPAYLQTSPLPSPVRRPGVNSSQSSPPRPKTRFDRFTTQRPSISTYRDDSTPSPPLAPNFVNISPTDSVKLPPPAVPTFSYVPGTPSYDMQRSPLHSLQRRTKSLTGDLQFLLDVQSAELMPGGSLSSTPRAYPRDSSPLPGSFGGNRTKKISLQQARNGMLVAMRELAEIKAIEKDVYASQVAEREELVDTMADWGRRTALLEKEIRNIEEGKQGKQSGRLREEKAEVEREIQELRVRLSKLEDRYAALTIQLSELESTISSKASSYRSSLGALKHKTAKFLETHCFPSPSTATESWTLEREALLEKKAQAKVESDALYNGIVMWEESLSLVYEFETSLRSQLAGNRGGDAKRDIMQRIEDVIEALGERLESAQSQGWKLLVCCIGAELQAFKEAREMMKRSLTATPAPQIKTPKLVATDSDEECEGKGINRSGGNGPIEERVERIRARERALDATEIGDGNGEDNGNEEDGEVRKGKRVSTGFLGDSTGDLRSSIYMARNDYSSLGD